MKLLKKWLLCYFYNPNKNNISKALDDLKYDNVILLGDFNIESEEENL